MKKLLTLVLIVGVAILMTLTCPDKKAHKEAMMKAVKELVDEEAELGRSAPTELLGENRADTSAGFAECFLDFVVRSRLSGVVNVAERAVETDLAAGDGHHRQPRVGDFEHERLGNHLPRLLVDAP